MARSPKPFHLKAQDQKELKQLLSGGIQQVRVVLRALALLLLDEGISAPKVSRTVPFAAIDRMCASIREFGFKIPCLVRSDGEVVDGHLRLKAARKLGITEIPVILCDEWTPAQVKAFRLMVNRSVGWANWDEELLALELQEIQDRCLQILRECGFLPTGPGFGLVNLCQIPDGLNADELERFLREDGAETRGFRGAQDHGGPAGANLRAAP
jgi:hypothetical protein